MEESADGSLEWAAQIFDQRAVDLEPRFAAGLLLRDIDYEAQLWAVRELLQQHRTSAQSAKDEIDRIQAQAKLRGGLPQQDVDDQIERMHESVYQSAAHSMAAVGMLAPLLESMFHQGYLAMEEHLAPRSVDPLSMHARWQSVADGAWDCHFVWNKGNRNKNVVEGILQLAEATGLQAHLPADVGQVLAALFGYRNKMFHCGFEWHPDERGKFVKRIREERWPSTWFDQATTGGDPWVFYMTDAFIAHCLNTIDAVVTAFGQFARVHVLGRCTDSQD